MAAPLKQYRYVQVVNTRLSSNEIAQAIGTTASEDRENGLDFLITHHFNQIKPWGILAVRILACSVSIMSSEGESWHRDLSPEEIQQYIDMAKRPT